MNNFKPAGFWMRVLAVLIDGIFSSVLATIIGTLMNDQPSQEEQMQAVESSQNFFEIVASSSSPSQIISNLIYVIVFIIIFTATQLKGSPGKLITRIQVVNAKDMSQISILKSIGRYFAYLLSSIILAIGLMMAGWNKEKKALHDIICSTRVVYRNQQE